MTARSKQTLKNSSLLGWSWYLPLAIVLIWYGGADLLALVLRWWRNPDYLHGFLVIPFSLYLLWHRRASCDRSASQSSNWGLLLVALAIVMKCVSAYISDPLIGPLSLVPCLAGMVWYLGGWAMLRWSWPSIVFLVFMFPLPSFVATWGNLQLQRVAVVSSTFVLQSLGVAAVGYGTTIVMTDGELSIAEACSGLRSTMLFFAVSVGAALIVKGIPEKLTVILSAIPATIIANVARISATGIVHQRLGADVADVVFHDLFGFLMLPMAALIVWGEIGLVRRLLVTTEPVGPLPVAPQVSRRAPGVDVDRELEAG